MPKFSTKSLNKLKTCHPLIQEVVNEVIKTIDIKVDCGERGEKAQNKAVAEKRSQVEFPHSMHNPKPPFNISMAVDVIPYPVDWKDLRRFYFMGGIVLAIAKSKGIPLMWGADWDRDYDITDERFIDCPHFELIIDELSPEQLAITDHARSESGEIFSIPFSSGSEVFDEDTSSLEEMAFTVPFQTPKQKSNKFFLIDFLRNIFHKKDSK